MIDLDDANEIAKDIIGTMLEEGVPKPLARAAIGIAYARLARKIITDDELVQYTHAVSAFTEAFFAEGRVN